MRSITSGDSNSLVDGEHSTLSRQNLQRSPRSQYCGSCPTRITTDSSATRHPSIKIVQGVVE